ncbi:hypothetical protein Tco_1517086 [Tanacetum coccineum]
MIAHHNDWDTSAHRGESSTTSSSSEIAALAQQMVEMRKDMLQMFCSNQQVNSVTPSCETCGGLHSYYECQAAGGYTQDVYATTGNYNSGGNAYQPQGDRNLLSYRSNNFLGPPGNQNQGQLTKALQERPQGALPSNTIPNPREQINSITTRSGLTTAKPSIPPLVPPTPREEVEQESKTLMDEVHITSPASTAHVPPLGIQPLSPPKPKEDPKPNPHQPKIPYPSRLDKTKLLNKNDVQISKFLKILKQLHFDISLMDALTQIPKYHKVLKDLLKDKEKLEELSNTLINDECSAILLNKVPEKLGDPRKFLIPCILQDLEADLRVPIILGRPFLCTAKALVDLYKEKLTLRVGNEQVVFYTDKSSRNNSRDIQSVHSINIIDFSKDKLISGSTTFFSDSYRGTFICPCLTCRTSDSLRGVRAMNDVYLLDPFPPGNEDDNFDHEADLKEIEYLLNRDQSTDSSPTTDIDIIDPILKTFTDEPALIYLSLPGDDEDGLFDLKSDNEEWKTLLYGDLFDNTHSENEKNKDLKIERLIDDMDDDLLTLSPIMMNGKSFCMVGLFLTFPKESSKSSEVATLLSSPFENEDKVFNPGILILGGTQIFNNESKDKDFKVNTSSEALLILEELNFLSISSD